MACGREDVVPNLLVCNCWRKDPCCDNCFSTPIAPIIPQEKMVKFDSRENHCWDAVDEDLDESCAQEGTQEPPKEPTPYEVPENLKHQADFFKLAYDLGKKAAQKNSDYGSAFDQINRIFLILYPDGIKPQQYSDATILVRMLDKVCRIANGGSKFFAEDSWHDIFGYSLVRLIDEERKNGKPK